VRFPGKEVRLVNFTEKQYYTEAGVSRNCRSSELTHNLRIPANSVERADSARSLTRHRFNDTLTLRGA
ncbi:MAG TPA: hypothetical protein VIJ63_13055, partial [Roseiarcus sp.]